MPIYSFHCSHCGNVFEEITIRAEWSKIRCPECGKKPHKLLTAPSHFEIKGANAENSYGLKEGKPDGKDME